MTVVEDDGTSTNIGTLNLAKVHRQKRVEQKMKVLER